jgi:hypothetical protein
MRRLIVAPIIVGVVIVGMAVYLVWLMCTDAPPIPNDYTMADLRSAPADCNESSYVLARLSRGGDLPDSSPTGLTEDDVATGEAFTEMFQNGSFPPDANVISMAARIEQAWEHAKRGRDVVSELGRFAEIADFTEPLPATMMDQNLILQCHSSIKRLTYLYRTHALLQLAKGNEEEAAHELIAMDSVFRKLTANARDVSTKYLCVAGTAMGIHAAAYISSRPNTSRKTVELLSAHFVPLSEPQTSYANSRLFQYLLFRANVDWVAGSAGRKVTTCKRNSSLRLYRNLTRLYTGDRFSIWPTMAPIRVDVTDPDRLPWQYKYYNPSGVRMLGLFVPAWARMNEHRTRIQIDDDMLQVVLARRLGKPYSLKARAYSEEYVTDANSGRIVSPGPDMKMGTADDIWLPIGK